jgi:hypothetical protein
MLLGVITVGRKAQREAQRNVRQRCGTGGRTMGRMIDAGKILDNLSGMLKIMDDYDAVKKVINDMPTAYDVDAVVKQLEEEKNLHKRMIKYEQKNGTVTEEFQARRAVEVLERVIEIVKGGGVDGN